MKKTFITIILVAGISFTAISQRIQPANPNTSPEARALIQLYYKISGKYTLTGQHNYPNTRDRNTRFAVGYEGQTPVIWSSDMGFAKADDYDSYLARPDIVKEAIRQHQRGSIITLCWHAVPPTANEPVTFQPSRTVSPDSLASVQGRLPEYQFRDLLTPGTKLYDHWAAQVDSVAKYLKMLEQAKVPVLWRPYHEMNGDWFWWGGRVGEYSTADLYRQMYDRLVNYHHLNNLVWVWNVDRPSTPIRKFSNFYPGNEYLDILSLDVYGADFNQAYYDSLVSLSQGKPVLLGEVGNPPSLDVLKTQAKWASWVIWAGFVRSTSRQQFNEFMNSDRMLYLEDPAYWQVSSAYRKACGFQPLPVKDIYNANYSGTWVLNEGKSDFGTGGLGNIPYKMFIERQGEQIMVKKFTQVEWADDRVTNEEILLDGSPVTTRAFNTPRVSLTTFYPENKSFTISSSSRFERAGQVREMKSNESWKLSEDGNSVVIEQTSTGFRDEDVKVILVYERVTSNRKLHQFSGNPDSV